MTEVTRYAACCDVGGAKALCGPVDEAGRVLAWDRYLLGASRESGRTADEPVSRLRILASEAGVAWNAAIGVGCGAAVMADIDRGVLLSAPNMLGFHWDVPFRDLVQAAAGRPAVVEMDAYAAALGEAWKGVGKGIDYFVTVVVGIGIGAGILMRGQAYRGSHGTVGEVGPTTIVPGGPRRNCGRYGCLEALARDYERLFELYQAASAMAPQVTGQWAASAVN